MPRLLALSVIVVTGTCLPVCTRTPDNGLVQAGGLAWRRPVQDQLPVVRLIRNIVLLLAGLMMMSSAHALSYLKLSIGKVESPTLNAQGLALTVTGLNTETLSIQGRARAITVQQASPSALQNLAIDCAVSIQPHSLTCDDGKLSFQHPQLQARQSPLSIHHHPAQQQLSVTASALRLLGGRLDTSVELQLATAQPQWQAGLRLDALQLNDQAVSSFAAIPQDLAFSSLLSGQLNVTNVGEQLTVSPSLTFSELAFSDAEGKLLGDALKLSLAGKLSKSSDRLQSSSMSLTIGAGEVLTPWFYSDFSQRKLSLKARDLRWDNDWRVAKLSLSDGVLSIDAGQLTGNDSGLQSAELNVKPFELGNVYPFYLQPVFSQELAQMTVEGTVSARSRLIAGKLAQYDVRLDQISLAHEPATGPAKYEIEGLSGLLQHDQSAATVLPSDLKVSQARLLDTLEIGQLEIPLELTADSLAFAEAVEFPVFDGSLVIEQFDMTLQELHPAISFTGFLTPLDLSLITNTLGWPDMQGKISGVIPQVSYQDRNARMDGTLLIKVFDGNILLKGLQTSHLLSDWPVLQTDLEFIGIDLEQLTQTFEFGRITGAIDGRVDDLVLENWRPSQFDAVFQTAEKSPRKRISQKAVDNISNLGGAGMAGALSRTFMRFFEDFGYERLGFSCRLRDGICDMDGVAPANQGYYLVKGGGIPRIDVIGHNRQTDWNILVDRLMNISESGTPTIQ